MNSFDRGWGFLLACFLGCVLAGCGAAPTRPEPPSEQVTVAVAVDGEPLESALRELREQGIDALLGDAVGGFASITVPERETSKARAFVSRSQAFQKAIWFYEDYAAPRLLGTVARDLTGKALERLDQGELFRALAFANASLAIQPRDAHSFAIRAFIWLRAGDVALARKDFKAALSLEDPSLHGALPFSRELERELR